MSIAWWVRSCWQVTYSHFIVVKIRVVHHCMMANYQLSLSMNADGEWHFNTRCYVNLYGVAMSNYLLAFWAIFAIHMVHRYDGKLSDFIEDEWEWEWHFNTNFNANMYGVAISNQLWAFWATFAMTRSIEANIIQLVLWHESKFGLTCCSVVPCPLPSLVFVLQYDSENWFKVHSYDILIK